MDSNIWDIASVCALAKEQERFLAKQNSIIDPEKV
jgi:hypothetical protein